MDIWMHICLGNDAVRRIIDIQPRREECYAARVPGVRFYDMHIDWRSSEANDDIVNRLFEARKSWVVELGILALAF